MNVKVEICGVDTSTLSKFSNVEMNQLLTAIRDGDEVAKEKFIIGNMRLVLSVIKRFWNKKENIDDIFQVGCVGLLKAVKNFDLGVGVRFSTYAVPMIMGEIRRFLRDNNSLRVSRSQRDTAYKALTAKDQLERTLNREVTLSEVAAAIDVPLSEVVFALDAISDPISIYEPVYNQGGDEILLMDQLGGKDDDNKWTENVALCDALNGLSEKERKIVYLRYYQGKTQVEVSREIDISQAQVSRLEKCAIQKIKELFL